MITYYSCDYKPLILLFFIGADPTKDIQKRRAGSVGYVSYYKTVEIRK